MKYCILLACFCLPFLGQTQSASAAIQIDDRLYDIYEADYLDRLLKERPFLIQKWNFYLENAYYLTDDEKALSQDQPTIVVKDVSNINIIALMREYELLSHPQLEKSYRIANSSQVLVLRSSRDITEALNKHLGRQHPKK